MSLMLLHSKAKEKSYNQLIYQELADLMDETFQGL